METKKPIKINLKVLVVIIGIILFLIEAIVLVLLNREERIDQYIVEGLCSIKEEWNNEYSIFPTPKNTQIINSYSEYMDTFSNNDLVLNLLENVVNEDFFNSNSLILFEESTAYGDLSEYVSKVNIKKDIATITIKKTKHRSNGPLSMQYRAYFIPIDNKNITGIVEKYKYELKIGDIIKLLLNILPIIILIIVIIGFYKIKQNKK